MPDEPATPTSDPAMHPGPTPAVSRRTLLSGGAAAGAVLFPLAASAQAKTVTRKRTPPVAPGLPAPGPIAAAHTNPADLSVLEAASLLQAAELSSAELTAACQARIAERNGTISFTGSDVEINAWIRTYPQIATSTATAADARIAKARRQYRHAPALTGVPVGLKDLYSVKGLPVTASSKILGGDLATGENAIAGNIASGDSTPWRKLEDAGMVLLGHAHTDEFAFLAVTPQCGNPWDTTLITGGSSGGPAAALAARMTPAALGSDTLGSLRVPAAFCGVSSIKPTFGLISAYGVIPLCWSLDTCGPMARTVADCALMLEALAGADANDPSTDVAQTPPARYPTLPRSGAKPLKGSKIAVPSNLGTPGAGPSEIFSRTQSELTALGATVVELAVPPNPFSEVGLIQAYTDALSYHQQWYPSQAERYKAPASQVLAACTALNTTALEYLTIMRTRASYQATWKQFLADNDLDAAAVLISLEDPPARSSLATGSPLTNSENSNLLTFMFSYLGFPTVTVPGGISTASSLPVGIQLVGAPFSETRLIQLAIDLQHHYPHYAEDPFNR
jgi:aspartyl-tRNA(Asn)/glutamyl-tRNA(Gln) amidotransferase subunit A